MGWIEEVMSSGTADDLPFRIILSYFLRIGFTA
jgi:hypothetical protein